jgi:hypothetical membrane protein
MLKLLNYKKPHSKPLSSKPNKHLDAMTAPKNRLPLKIAGLFGMLIPVIEFSFIFSAIALYPSFNWTNNALSDLGVVLGLTSVLFNVGLILTAVWALIFAVGLLETFRGNRLGQASAVVFGLACCALILIGIFNESFSPTHFLVSVMFFVLLPISLFTMTAAFRVAHKTKLAVFTVVIAFAAAVPWILYFTLNYASNVAIPEFASGLAGSVWAVVLGYKMIKEAPA